MTTTSTATMTDADTLRAERLALLSQRRPDRSVDATLTVDTTASAPTAPARRAQSRRRSPATTAKVLTVGASTTAVLGMMAGYGIAEQTAADKPILLANGDTIAAVAPAASAPTTPSTAPPQVIVVVIDGTTGQRISGDFDLSTLAAAPPDAAGTVAPTGPGLNSSPSSSSTAQAATPSEAAASPPAAVPAAVPAPAPVAAPVAVDLAVPAASPPPAPAPAPQATSSGS